MKNTLRWIILGSGLMAMGMGMPSCGQDELKQQIDTLEKSSTSTNKKVSALEGQLKQLATDVTGLKDLTSQLSQTVIAQKGVMEDLQKSLTELSTRMNKPAAKAPAGKKRR